MINLPTCPTISMLPTYEGRYVIELRGVQGKDRAEDLLTVHCLAHIYQDKIRHIEQLHVITGDEIAIWQLRI